MLGNINFDWDKAVLLNKNNRISVVVVGVWKMRRLSVLLLILIGLAFIACEISPGSEGQRGEQGEQGEKGEAGQIVLVTGLENEIVEESILEVGYDRYFRLNVEPVDATIQTVLWLSSNPSVLSIVSVERQNRTALAITGPATEIKATGVTTGTATLTATALGSGGEEISVSVTVKVITWGTWITTTPTCTEYGEDKRICTCCEENYQIANFVEPLGHNWGDWEITKAPTATEDGEESRVCSHDLSHIETRSISKGVPVTGENLIDKLMWLSINAVSNATYMLILTADEMLVPQTLSYNGRNDITIKLSGNVNEKIVTLSGYGSLFTVEYGVTLVLDNNITLEGRNENNAALISIYNGGKLIMNTGAKITGNSNISILGGHGGGVEVRWGAIFIMRGGSISGNTATAGGGVLVFNTGRFEMSGGEISSNTANGNGGGVSVFPNNAIFTISGGKIFNNTATNAGGGVMVNNGAIFEMSDGEISGNIANGNGGGVFVNSSGTFRISGGMVYGSGEAVGIRNTASSGAALFNLDTAQHGTFNGYTWVNNGNLITTDNTIRVVNGILQ